MEMPRDPDFEFSDCDIVRPNSVKLARPECNVPCRLLRVLPRPEPTT